MVKLAGRKDGAAAGDGPLARAVVGWPSLDGVLGGGCGVCPAAGCGPGHGARVLLGKCPAGDLFRAVMSPADGVNVAPAGDPALVVRDAMIEVAGLGGPAAAGVGAGGIADADEVLEAQPWPVADGGVAVGTGAGVQGGDGQGGEPVPGGGGHGGAAGGHG